MKYVRDEANNLYEALDKAEQLAQIASAVNTEKNRAMAAEAEEKARAMAAEAAEQTALNNKVDKVQGKALSTNDFTDHHKEIVEQMEAGAVTGIKGEKESAYRTGQVNLTPANIGAVATESGKGLSTNDFTNALKTKLDGIAAGAQVNTITGVKGNAESSYRHGNVNITPANIGAPTINDTNELVNHTREMIAPAETSPATAAHTVGSYITYNGAMKEVIAPIAIGDTLGSSNTKNTNAGAEIQQINADFRKNTINNDYVTIRVGETFTAPNDGYVLVGSGLQAGSYSKVLINGILPIDVVSFTAVEKPPRTPLFVKKGMTITHESSNLGLCYFFELN